MPAGGPPSLGSGPEFDSTRRISVSALRPTSSWRSSGSRVPTRRWISYPGRRISFAARVCALRSHQAKTSTAAAVEASATALPASGPGFSTARRRSSVPARLDASIGATRCEPQRSCSFVASAASASSAS